MAVLGIGDLHPGGRGATEFLLRELDKARPGRVLEVGAGIGFTTRRMLGRGWAVTALEPNPVMRDRLERRLGVRAQPQALDGMISQGAPYDAVIGESVFYALDPPSTLLVLQRLLRPGGLLAFTDLMWTEAANEAVVAFIHDQTKAVFGIPVAPRTLVTWATWTAELKCAGFREVCGQELRLETSTPERWQHRLAMAASLMRHPTLWSQTLRYHLLNRVPWVPSAWLEGRAAVWQRL